jgi:serine/threonine-protein kinase
MATETPFEKDADRLVEQAPSQGPRASSEPVEEEPMPRTLGRYVLLRRIARGGMGEVFLASTIGLEGAERPVVVKIIRRDHAKDPSFIARFLDEARVQAQLSCSGVAQVLDAAIDDATGEPYAVVEHVEGKSLGDLRARALQLGQRFSWFDAVSIGSLIAEALAFIHERQDPSGRALAIVHRDLSPQNVMVSYAGDVKIIDFGTARGQNRRCHTVAGVVFAKPGYVAPEVANGDSGDARVDLYALGVMLWELCAGRRFLQGEAAEHLAAVAKNERSLPPIASEIGAPPELDEILAKLTVFERDERYPLARHAARDLAKLLTCAPPLASGERGVRARVAELTRRFFPGEPGRARREFARLVAHARSVRPAAPPPRESRPSAPSAPPPAPPSRRVVDDIDDPTLLAGTRYRLVREIGRGASSVVHEAEHADLGRRVALKILSAEHSSSPEFAARFRREARILSSLQHEGLVALHDFGATSDGRLFCVQELCEGETLESLFTRDGALPWRDALRVVGKALAGLEVAHAAGLVHRDIKPQNLFLTLDGGVKVLDFGLAHAEGEDVDAKSAVGEVTLFGTPEYMAPEQATAGRLDARADVYAIGCVLYELLTGRLPFVAKSAALLLDAKAKGSPERPRDRAPMRDIPAAVDELVMCAIARHPTARFQSAAEMARAVDAALRAPERRRRVGRAVGLVAFVGAMLAAVGLLAVGSPRTRAAVTGAMRLHRPAVVAIAAGPAAVAVDALGATATPVELGEAELAAADRAVAAYPPETTPPAAVDTGDDAPTEDIPAVALGRSAKVASKRGGARGATHAAAKPEADKAAVVASASAGPVEVSVLYEPQDHADKADKRASKGAKKAKEAAPRHKRKGRVAQRPE